MERIVILLFGLLILSSSLEVFAKDAPEPRTEQDVDSASEALFDEYWQAYLKEYPEIATFQGDQRYDDRLDSYCLKCVERKKAMLTKFLERGSQLLPLAKEGSNTYNNLQFFVIFLQFKIDKIADGSYLFPFSNLITPKMNLQYLLDYVKLQNAKNYWDLIARYRAFPQQIDGIIEVMREGIRKKYTLHKNSLWKPKGEQILSASESPFYVPFSNISSSISAEEARLIQSNASDAIMNSLYPALKKLDDFIKDEYRPKARKKIGVSSLPNGSEFYRQELIGFLTDRSATAKAVYDLGMQEVNRINQEMNELIQSTEKGENKTREAFDFKLRHEDSNFFSSKEEALAEFRNVIFNVIAPKLPLVFKKIPQKPLRVEMVPEDLAGGPLAYYMQASPDNSTPATFYMDATSLRGLPKHEVMTLSLHEGNPGHHLQISYAMEQSGVPDFRKYNVESGAYTEGWGLYAEFLGNELGLFKDPYSRYGHLSYEMLRATRMVVDTGMHAFGWSRQRAIDFMMKYTASPLENVKREVDRYITWPGQACSYKYGELKIEQLRKKAEKALGDKFDIKDFHDVILRNSGPLELVEKQVDHYIKSTNQQ